MACCISRSSFLFAFLPAVLPACTEGVDAGSGQNNVVSAANAPTDARCVNWDLYEKTADGTLSFVMGDRAEVHPHASGESYLPNVAKPSFSLRVGVEFYLNRYNGAAGITLDGEIVESFTIDKGFIVNEGRRVLTAEPEGENAVELRVASKETCDPLPEPGSAPSDAGDASTVDQTPDPIVEPCLLAYLYAVDGDAFSLLSGAGGTLDLSGRSQLSDPQLTGHEQAPRASAVMHVEGYDGYARLLWDNAVVAELPIDETFLFGDSTAIFAHEDDAGARVELHVWSRAKCSNAPLTNDLTRADVEALERE